MPFEFNLTYSFWANPMDSIGKLCAKHARTPTQTGIHTKITLAVQPKRHIMQLPIQRKIDETPGDKTHFFIRLFEEV